jgi:O-antigen/teichoic acid export membrane protein
MTEVMNHTNPKIMRTIGIRKSILAGLLGKGVGFMVNLMIVPISLKYLGQQEFGYWSALYSTILWLNFFDLGLGAGLQNYLTIALAQNDMQQARRMVSSVFFAFCGIALTLLALSFIWVPIIHWDVFFNAPSHMATGLRRTVFMVLFLFIFQFPFSITQSIYSAYQQKYRQIFWNALTALLTLMMVFCMTRRSGGMVNLALATSGSLWIVSLLNACYVYWIWKKPLRPSLACFSFDEIKRLFRISLSFMGLQLAALIFYQMDHFIILKTLGPDSVTAYAVVQRLFLTLLALFTLVANPFWPAITDAFARQEIGWIKNALKRLNKIVIFLLGPVITLLVLFGRPVMAIWLKNDSYYSIGMFSLFGIVTLSLAFQSVYSYVMNGCNQPGLVLKLTFYAIPVYIFFVMTGIHIWGLNGFLAGKIIANTFVILFMQISMVHKKILKMPAHTVQSPGMIL